MRGNTWKWKNGISLFVRGVVVFSDGFISSFVDSVEESESGGGSYWFLVSFKQRILKSEEV